MYSIPVDESMSELNLQVSSFSSIESVSIADSTGTKLVLRRDFIFTLLNKIMISALQLRWEKALWCGRVMKRKGKTNTHTQHTHARRDVL